jgi:hypothetical protein
MATHILTVESTKRLQNTKNGNPRIEVTFTNGQVHRTEPDSSWSFDWVNIHDSDKKVDVEVEINTAGNLSDVRIIGYTELVGLRKQQNLARKDKVSD